MRGITNIAARIFLCWMMVILPVWHMAAQVSGPIINWASWSNDTVGNPGGSVTGNITIGASVIGVSYSGEVYSQTQLKGASGNYYVPVSTYTNSVVPNAPTNGMITFVGGNSTVDTITFSQPVTNPVIALVSLGSPDVFMHLAFDAPSTILSSAAGYWGSGPLLTETNDVVYGQESDGTIQFYGAYSSISWTASPADSYYTGLTIGVPNPSAPFIERMTGGNVTIFQGQPWALTVSAQAELPATNQWQLSGTNLMDRAGLSGTGSNVLSFSNAQITDSGTYTFAISNVFGWASTNVALTVLPASAENTFNAYASAVTNISGLLGYWRFDPTFVWNSCVNGYTGTNDGGAQIGAAGSGWPLTVDPYNQSALLNGSSAYVHTSLTGQIGNQGTMLAWVYLTTEPSSAGHIFSIINQSANGDNYDIQIETDNSTRFYAGNATAVYSTALSLNQWHFLAGTLTNTGVLNLYLDGALVATATGGGHSVTANSANIGESLVFTGRFFQGRIDEAAYYNVPLSGAQIAELYDLAVPPKLGIALAGRNAVLTWPTNYAGLLLQGDGTPNIPGGWSAFPMPYSIRGTNYAVTNAIGPASYFYRLSD